MRRYTRLERAAHKAVLGSMSELRRSAFAMAVGEGERVFAQRLWSQEVARFYGDAKAARPSEERRAA